MSASEFLNSKIVRTPLVPLLGTNIYMKPENLQPFGSYKIRGIAELIAKSDAETLQGGLVTVSAGNMAQAVAFASKVIGVNATIFVPKSAPEVKKTAIKNLGAILIEEDFDKIWNYVVKGTNPLNQGVFVHPTQTPQLLSGYGSIANEIIDDLPSIDTIVIPFGVGGMATGIARQLKKMRPEVKIILVEPSTSSPMFASISKGAATQVERIPSFIDAIGTPQVLPEVFDELSKCIHDVVTVTPDEARECVKLIAKDHRMIIEGAAACAVAAAKKISHRYQKIACILSGGNISPSILTELLNGPS